MKQISVNPNFQTAYIPVFQKGEPLPSPVEQGHADTPVPQLKYRVSCLTQHTSNYLSAARPLTFGVLACLVAHSGLSETVCRAVAASPRRIN